MILFKKWANCVNIYFSKENSTEDKYLKSLLIKYWNNGN